MQPLPKLARHVPDDRPIFVAVLEDVTGNGDEIHITCDPAGGDATIELFEAGRLSAIAVEPVDIHHPATMVATVTLATSLSGTLGPVELRDVTLAVTWSVLPTASGYSFDVTGTGFVVGPDGDGYRRFRSVGIHWLTRFGHLEEAAAASRRAHARCGDATKGVVSRRRIGTTHVARPALRWWAPRSRHAA